MTDLLGHIGNTVTIAKGLYEICKEYENAKLIKQISDLTLEIAQVQNEVAEMMAELRSLKAEKEEQETNPINYDGIVYRDKDNQIYCPACYDNQRKRIHLKPPYWTVSKTYLSICPICDNKFDLKS